MRGSADRIFLPIRLLRRSSELGQAENNAPTWYWRALQFDSTEQDSGALLSKNGGLV